MRCRAIQLIILSTMIAPVSLAHPELGNSLQHRIMFTADAGRTELVIEVTFDGERSLRERRAIDTDGDGTLSKPEREAYLTSIEAESEKRVALTINGTLAPLVALYAAELDFFDSRDMERHPHVLRLTYFTAARCAPGDVVTIRDDLWPDSPAIMLAEPVAGAAMRTVPRQPRASGSGAAATAERDVSFSIAAVGLAGVKPGGHTCSASCRHTSMSKGRPGGHRNH